MEVAETTGAMQDMRSSSQTVTTPAMYRPDAPPDAKPTVSEH